MLRSGPCIPREREYRDVRADRPTVATKLDRLEEIEIIAPADQLNVAFCRSLGQSLWAADIA